MRDNGTGIPPEIRDQLGDIRPQVLRAIEDAKHFVLILSRRALTSATAR